MPCGSNITKCRAKSKAAASTRAATLRQEKLSSDPHTINLPINMKETDLSTTPNGETRFRILILSVSVTLALLVILLCNIIPMNERLARFLVDKQAGADGINLFAAQNFMWIAFFWGLGELLVRYIITGRMAKELSYNMLPTDASTVLIKRDMPRIHEEIRKRGGKGLLARLIRMLALQFQTTESFDMANDILNAETELLQNEIDLSYNTVRYIAWLIPTLGFIGTVWGILEALNVAALKQPTDPDLLSSVIGALSVAFWTTLLALLMACVLMLILHLTQNREEITLNRCSQYCLNNFINRLYVEK